MRDEMTGALQRVAMGLILSLSFASVSLAHESPGYAHDARVLTRNPDWMGKLKDGVKLSQLSIPGTHDTMSRFGGPIVETQTLTLANQLESGIRVFDMRCRHVRYNPDHYTFAMVHGSVHQNAFFDDVLKDTVRFLDAHKGETVLMRVVPAGTPQNIPPGRTFEMTFRERYWNNPAWKDYFWQGTGQLNPTLGQMRGKIVVLQQFDSPRSYGIPYTSFDIQDQYRLRTNSDLYDKWTHVLTYIRKANAFSENRTFMNYLSGSTGAFPYFVASGHSNPTTGAPRLPTGLTTPGWRNTWLDFPRVNCWRAFWTNFCTIAFEGTNILTYEHLRNNNRPVGVIMSDFPGPGLIAEVIVRNDRYRNRK